MNFLNDSDLLDQHFLINEKYIKDFIKICNLQKDDIVLEVGPGVGTLTKLIAPKVAHMYVIEKDIRLKEYLENIPGIEIIFGDVIKCNLPKVNKIITSLPYSIIEPFIYKMKNLTNTEIYMIMGKNYIDNVINKKITNLSLLTNTFFDSLKYEDIPPAAFDPAPKVMSSVIKLTPKRKWNTLESIIKNIYLLDEKKLKNALLESLIIVKKYTKKEAKEVIKSLNIDEEILNKQFNILNNDEIKKVYEILLTKYALH